MSFLYLVMTTLKMLTFSVAGFLHWEDIWISLPSVLTILAGAHTGQYLHKKIQVAYFRWVVLSVVGISSVMLLIIR